jgi:hypothetical protein
MVEVVFVGGKELIRKELRRKDEEGILVVVAVVWKENLLLW